MTQHLASLPSNAVFAQGDNLVTTSVKVAESFNKQHKNVLQKLENLDCSDGFALANFSAHVQNIDIGNGAKRESKIYQITKDGFMFLVMGFTGKKAAAIKEAYINAFNDMAAKLYPVISNQSLTPSQQADIKSQISNIAHRFPQPEQHATYSKLYGRLKSYFKVAKYDQIPCAEFKKASAFLKEQEALLLPSAAKLSPPTTQNVTLPAMPTTNITVVPASYLHDVSPSPMGALLNKLLEAESAGAAVTLKNMATASRDYQLMLNLIRQQQNKLDQIECAVKSDLHVHA